MGLGAVYNAIGGDFDGQAGLSNGTEVIILPDLDAGLGIDLLAGFRIDDRFSLEFDFMTSKHSGTWEGLKGDAGYLGLNFNGKYSFLATRTMQPYLLFGINYSLLVINDGAQDLMTGETSNATLFGSGFNLGTGIEQYIGPNTSLTIGVMYRYIEYTIADGLSGRGTIDNGVDGSGLSFKISTAYHF
jgi:opacity protein-like surface antigen